MQGPGSDVPFVILQDQRELTVVRSALSLMLLLATLAAAMTVAACDSEGDALSPLYFYSNRAGNDEIYAIEPDGSGLRRLTEEPARDYEARPSPDGRRLVFVSRRDGPTQLYTMDSDGSNQTRLTFSGDEDPMIMDDYPAWSPDGRRVIFQRTVIGDEGPQADVYVIDVESGEETRITTAPTWDSTPSWTPDGRYILFESDRVDAEGTARGQFDIWRMRADGSELLRLTTSDSPDLEVKASPDGRLLAFVSERDGDFNVYLMDPDGGNQRRLTDNQARDRCPVWLGDDTLAFFSDRDGNNELYVVRIDGTGLRRLTNDPGNDELC